MLVGGVVVVGWGYIWVDDGWYVHVLYCYLLLFVVVYGFIVG